jgi:hypothetical protein
LAKDWVEQVLAALDHLEQEMNSLLPQPR